MSPPHRRAAVRWAQDVFGVSERRACRVLHVSRRLVWYRSVRPDDAPIRRRLHELARTRVAYGSRRRHILLQRDGLTVNYKKSAPPRRRGRSPTQATTSPPASGGHAAGHRAPVTGPNHRWATDFMHDVLATGMTVRVFTLIDVWRRKCLTLRVAQRFTGSDVATILGLVQHQRGACARTPKFGGSSTTSMTWSASRMRGIEFDRLVN